MEEQIRAIEKRLGHKVYVGHIVGLKRGTIWACVDDDRIQCRRQVPADTKEKAVELLHAAVFRHG
jgi:uncharacterized protein (UPF0254 family)